MCGGLFPRRRNMGFHRTPYCCRILQGHHTGAGRLTKGCGAVVMKRGRILTMVASVGMRGLVLVFAPIMVSKPYYEPDYRNYLTVSGVGSEVTDR